MNPDSHRNDALLDELILDDAASHAPPVDTVLVELRREKRRHFRTQAAVALFLTTAFSAALFFRREGPPAPNLAHARHTAPTPSGPPLERIDGPTMLRELGDQPAALATLPDGTQRLILLVSLPQDPASPAE